MILRSRSADDPVGPEKERLVRYCELCYEAPEKALAFYDQHIRGTGLEAEAAFLESLASGCALEDVERNRYPKRNSMAKTSKLPPLIQHSFWDSAKEFYLDDEE